MRSYASRPMRPTRRSMLGSAAAMITAPALAQEGHAVALPQARSLRRRAMRAKHRWVGTLGIVVLALMLGVPPGAAQAPGSTRLQNVDPNDWPMYHRTYDSWRYSPLAQINKTNVRISLWRGCTRPNRRTRPGVHAGRPRRCSLLHRLRQPCLRLDGATGKEIWHYYPKLDPS